MRTLHRWFASGEYSLLGHIHPAGRNISSRGIVIVPPFGWEDVCSYRPLRFLAESFADNGIPALRFDLPGTGDSSGDARDSGLFEAWVQAVTDAADVLRGSTGVDEVAVLGIHMGAMAALMAAVRGGNIQDLILWGPAFSGRAVLRELRAFSKMARAEYANGAESPPQPIPGLEIGGFLMSPETQLALETLEFLNLPPMPGRRALVLGRDDLPADEKVVGALQTAGCSVEVQAGMGYTEMMAIPEEARSPVETGRAIIRFLRAGSREQREGTTFPSPVDSTTAVRTGAGNFSERIFPIEGPGGSMFGILTEPSPDTPPSDWCLVMLNPGAVRHTGPNRMWVEAARRSTAGGIMSLRLDLQGIGESDGESSLNIPQLYQDRLVEQVEIAMESLRSRTGARRFVLVGLCSGAFWAFHTAIRNRDVRGAILLNPRLFFWDPEVDRRRILRRTARLFTHGADWMRLLRGYVTADSFRRVSQTVLDRVRTTPFASGRRSQISAESMRVAWAALERNQSRVALIFTEGEPLLREMEEEGHLPRPGDPRVHCVRVTNCGHTFRPLWAQQLAHELIDRELQQVLCENTPEHFRAGLERPSIASETCPR